MTGPAKHLTFGGSTAHRWMVCHGSVGLVSTLPPQIESEHMARGTRAHALLEHLLRERSDDALIFEGLTLAGAAPPYDREDVEAVQVALDHVNGILEKYPDAIMWVEQRVTLFPDVGGTVDVMIYVPAMRLLFVVDYKHGAGHYVTEQAPQFKFYATCAVMTRDDLDVGTIFATVIQPRCWQGDPVRTAVYSVADLIAYSDDVEEAVTAAKGPSPAFVPGDQCDWCPAAHVCPAHRDSAFEVVTLPLNGDRAPVGEEIKIMLPPPGECRDPAVLAQTLPALAAIKSWVAAMEDVAFSEAMGGRKIPGHKLVAKRGTRKWTDEEAAEGLLSVEVGDEDDYAPRKLVSVAQAEKLLKGNKSAITALAAFVEKKSSGFKLVPETEPGDAVNPLELLALSGGSASDVIT